MGGGYPNVWQSALFYPPLIASVVLSLCLLTSALRAQEYTITLLNGDCDSDNEITLFDFAIVVSALGSTPTDPEWDPRADLDGDLEVTLFDYGVLLRNFGEIGADPFDPTAPRQPFPASGLRVWVRVDLGDWQGGPQLVIVEARCDGDSTVYTAEMWTGGPFALLHLPQSGFWQVRVNNVAHWLSAQICLNRAYVPGPPIFAEIVFPREGETFGDRSRGSGIRIHVRVVDYDDVTSAPADRSLTFTNRERELYAHLSAQWRITQGEGQIEPVIPEAGPHLDAIYIPPHLEGDDSMDVEVQCTISDNSPDPARRDNPVTITTRFTITKNPSIHILTCYAIDNSGRVVGLPISSGVSGSDTVRLRFEFTALRNSWGILNVHWSTPWPGTVQNDWSFVTNPVPSWEAHRLFGVSLTVTFWTSPDLIHVFTYSDAKTRTFPLCFRLTSHDERSDTSRGLSALGLYDPANWFDDCTGHWGSIIARFNEIDSNLEGLYVVYFVPRPFHDLPQTTLGLMDWQGVYAPNNPYNESYRGRIYLFSDNLMQYTDYQPARSMYGVVAGGIDRVANTVAHEFAHRDLWIASWGGFSAELIGGPDAWLPGDPNQGIDTDLDLMPDAYERKHTDDYHFDPSSPYAVELWWLVGRNIPLVSVAQFDAEIYAQLWGEWTRYVIGSHDASDWSTPSGRQNYWYWDSP